MYEIDIFDVHNVWTIIIIIFRFDTIKMIMFDALLQ